MVSSSAWAWDVTRSSLVPSSRKFSNITNAAYEHLVEAETGVEAGIGVRMDEYSHYEVAVIGDRIVVRARIGPLSATVGRAPRPGPSVVLSVETRPNRLGPDMIVLGFGDG
jgi:hypothetical protein